MHLAEWYLDFRVFVFPLFEQEFVQIRQGQKELIPFAGTDTLPIPMLSIVSLWISRWRSSAFLLCVDCMSSTLILFLFRGSYPVTTLVCEWSVVRSRKGWVITIFSWLGRQETRVIDFFFLARVQTFFFFVRDCFFGCFFDASQQLIPNIRGWWWW